MQSHDDFAAYKAHVERLLAFIGETRPVNVEPLAKILSERDYRTLNAIIDTGHVMRCTETDRLFVPSRCVPA